MKITVLDRVVLVLLGLLLCAVGGLLLYEAMVLQRSITLGALSVAGIPAALLGVLPVVMGIYLLTVALRREGKAGFVLQKTENGSVNISIKALEALVRKCTDQHQELQVERMHLADTRDGLMIHLKAAMPAGLNIPLVVGLLQKQIKQYVTACSGVDVKAVQVQVDHTAAPAKPSPYLVSELLSDGGRKEALPPAADAVGSPAADAAPIHVTAQVSPAEAHGDVLSDEPDDRPFHQQLFSREEEPVTVPAPPAEEETAPGDGQAEIPNTAEQPSADPAADSLEDGLKEIVSPAAAAYSHLSLSLEDALKQEGLPETGQSPSEPHTDEEARR